jgi:hypothetical protein
MMLPSAITRFNWPLALVALCDAAFWAALIWKLL